MITLPATTGGSRKKDIHIIVPVGGTRVLFLFQKTSVHWILACNYVTGCDHNSSCAVRRLVPTWKSSA